MALIIPLFLDDTRSGIRESLKNYSSKICGNSNKSALDDNKYIDYFLDTTPDKQNKFTPGTKIKILKYKNGINKDVDYVFLGAWNFKNEIFKKEIKFIKRGGKFITHNPYPKII